MRKTFWLSFVDPDSTAADKSLGACVVDVDDAQAAAEKQLLDAGPFAETAQPGAEWILAATRQAHIMACNPGGEVMASDVTRWPADRPRLPQKNRLFSRAELARLGFD